MVGKPSYYGRGALDWLSCGHTLKGFFLEEACNFHVGIVLIWACCYVDNIESFKTLFWAMLGG